MKLSKGDRFYGLHDNTVVSEHIVHKVSKLWAFSGSLVLIRDTADDEQILPKTGYITGVNKFQLANPALTFQWRQRNGKK